MEARFDFIWSYFGRDAALVVRWEVGISVVTRLEFCCFVGVEEASSRRAGALSPAWQLWLNRCGGVESFSLKWARALALLRVSLADGRQLPHDAST